MSLSRSLHPYWLLETRNFALRAPLVGLIAGAVMIIATHLVVPRLPEAASTVMEASFAIRGRPALLLLNDYLAVYAVLFFAGLTELLRALAAPREERQLELLLSKPVPASLFVRARALPVLVAVWLVGALLGGATALSIVPISSPDSATAIGAFGGFIAVSSVTVLQLAALAPLLVRSRDGFEALVIGFVVWLLPLLPATMFLYRPDLFEGHPHLASALVAPANLIWHDARMPVAALLLTAAATGISMALLALAGRSLRRIGVV